MKEAVTDDFFVLSTRLAGEILQKFINYGVRFAVYGDFSAYTSKSWKDFVYECNRGKDVYFQPDVSHNENVCPWMLCCIPGKRQRKNLRLF
ncbi:MAG: DUF4180 domain-containing protein [Lachnospiraceae bacterium]|nr:DUF4180 domain-containing protein [Lachnospiraceae bacterium]